MARVLLLNPPSPERLGAPLLGTQYVAAALLQAGHDVRVMDCAARLVQPSPEDVLAAVADFRPHVVGVSLFTRWVWHAYRLVRELREQGTLLVAGGPHATAAPRETIEQGFDAAVTGEAEAIVSELAERAEAGRPLDGLAGVWRRSGDGISGTPAAAIQDLDAIPSPLLAQRLYQGRWYQEGGGQVIPGGMLTSRGCPARCTFCANYVTGRRFRYRSAANVLEELNRYHREYGVSFFPFWDDALTADRARLLELCAAIETLDFPMRWSAITRANMVTREILAAMQRAGCVSVNFGVESGDDSILRTIKKGVATRHVVRALEWAKELDLQTACNFMLGFPEDTPETLENTVRFMERIAPLTDVFSTLGVVVPFPGTPLYDENHQRYGFTDWWLRPEYAQYVAPPPVEDLDRFRRHYIDDANLELSFFHYSSEVREWIREGLRYKAEHNLRRMGLETVAASAA
jgi:radical SAM superfamily enzyme YgiQ (UPF0313 family)